MKSATKRYIDREQIVQIFDKANLGAVTQVVTLDAGEFNTAYYVTANGKDYVIKIAPNSTEHVLTYEKDLMAREVAFYKLIEKNGGVKTPHVYYYDDSLAVINSAYFIMERLPSLPLTDCRLSEEERNAVYQKVGEALASMHTIKNAQFGYEQNGLYDNWYLAISAMVTALCNDCKRYNKKAKNGEKLLKYIKKHQAILEKVEATYTHFDVWDGNIFYDKKDGSIAIIDTERGFWGDAIGDFVSVEMFVDLYKKQSIVAYNRKAASPMTFSREELVRYNILKAYLGLIVYTERFARYKWWQQKYWLNLGLSKYFFFTSFRVLKG